MSLSATGIDVDQERTLFHALGIPEATEYHAIGFKMADCVSAYYKAHGYSSRVHCGGLILDQVAAVMRLGIEVGRRLEQAKVLDALFSQEPKHE